MFTFYFERRPRLHLAEKVKFSMKSFREITFAHFAFDVLFLYEEIKEKQVLRGVIDAQQGAIKNDLRII